MKHVSLCLLLIFVMLTGCSTVSSRIKTHPDAYAALSESDRGLVSLGKIREGLKPDAVYLAWGEADQIVRGSNRGSAFETWLYFAYEQQSLVSASVIPVYTRGYGRYGIYPLYEPLYVTRRYPCRSVTFQGGRVVEWADATR